MGGGQAGSAGQGSADHDGIEDDADEFVDVLSPIFHNHPASSFQQEVMRPSPMEAPGEGMRSISVGNEPGPGPNAEAYHRIDDG